MSQRKKSLGRRTFLVGLMTGAGVAVALGATPKKAAAKKQPAKSVAGFEPVLYRRTKEAERYYKTLYT
jgi:hypothetical protein